MKTPGIVTVPDEKREAIKARLAFCRASGMGIFPHYRLASVTAGLLTLENIEAAIEAARPELRELTRFNRQAYRDGLPEINLTQYRDLQAQAEKEEQSK